VKLEPEPMKNTFVCAVDSDTLTSFELSGEIALKLNVTHDRKGVYAALENGKDVTDAFTALYEKLFSLKAERLLDESVTDKGEKVLTAVFSTEEKGVHTLEIFKYNANFYLACFDGAADKLVSIRDVQTITKLAQEIK
jgi:hypothetical protein